MRLFEDTLDVAPGGKRGPAMSKLMETVDGWDVEFVTRAARDPRQGIRVTALTLLPRCMEGGRDIQKMPDIPAIYVDALKHPSAVVRFTASYTCRPFAPKSPKLLAALAEALNDPDRGSGGNRSISAAAAYSIGLAGPAARRYHRELIRATENERDDTRLMAIHALGAAGGFDPSWQPVYYGRLLAIASRSKIMRERYMAISTLEHGGRQLRWLMPQLRDLFRCADVPTHESRDLIRRSILMVYRAIGEESAPAAPDIHALLADKKTSVDLYSDCLQFFVHQSKSERFIPMFDMMLNNPETPSAKQVCVRAYMRLLGAER